MPTPAARPSSGAEPANTRLSSIDIKRQVLAGLCRGQRPPVDRDRRRQRAAQHMPALGGVAPEIMDDLRRRVAVDRGDRTFDPRIIAPRPDRPRNLLPHPHHVVPGLADDTERDASHTRPRRHHLPSPPTRAIHTPRHATPLPATTPPKT